MRLVDVADSRDNNFDVLRLFAASLVLISHSFPLTGGEDPFIVTGDTMGALGVALFFSMSGFLIVKSWLFQPNVAQFARKRALRIMPALIVATALTTLVLGTALTTLSVGAYLSSSETWGYLVKSSLLWPFGGELPGVFSGNPHGAAVNGSLWTLPIEVSAYCMVAVLGVLGLLRSRLTLPFGFFAALLLTIVTDGIAVAIVFRLFAYFLAGMLLYTHRSRIPLRWDLAVVAVVVWVASFGTLVMPAIGAMTLPYAVMVLAYRTPRQLRWVAGAGDVSYGLYIYAFPVQQTIVYLWNGDVGAWTVTAIALPVTWVCAFASWRLVERPALKLKPRHREIAPESVGEPRHEAALDPSHVLDSGTILPS